MRARSGAGGSPAGKSSSAAAPSSSPARGAGAYAPASSRAYVYGYGGYGAHARAVGADGLYTDSQEVPPSLLEWARGPEGEALGATVAAKTGVESLRFLSPRASTGYFEIRGASSDLVRAAAELLDLHLKHQVQLQAIAVRASALETDLGAAQEELRRGLRVEFPIHAEVVGMTIGKKGANVERVQAATGVDRIVVDADANPPIVRIRGADAEQVAEARRQIEYDIRHMVLTKPQVAWVMGSAGATTTDDIKAKSRVMKLALIDSVDGIAPAYLEITGLKMNVNTAVMLLETQLEYQEQFKR